MHYTGTIWRPPYEAYSLLIQVTAGCTHHSCKFCTLYEDLPFKFRMSPFEEVKSDLKEANHYYKDADRVFFTGAILLYLVWISSKYWRRWYMNIFQTVRASVVLQE